MNRFTMKASIQFVSTSRPNLPPQPLTNAEAWALLLGTYPDPAQRKFFHESLLAKTCGCVSVEGGMLEPVKRD